MHYAVLTVHLIVGKEIRVGRDSDSARGCAFFRKLGYGPGETVGNITLGSCSGAGGEGGVFRARTADQPVAVKLMGRYLRPEILAILNGTSSSASSRDPHLEKYCRWQLRETKKLEQVCAKASSVKLRDGLHWVGCHAVGLTIKPSAGLSIGSHTPC